MRYGAGAGGELGRAAAGAAMIPPEERRRALWLTAVIWSAAALAIVALSACGSLWYDPSKDPNHIERCEQGLETEFCW